MRAATDSEMDLSQTPARLLDAAESLFAEHGVDGASMRQIAHKAGANLAACHYHFGSKEGLVRAVFQRRLSELNAARLAALSAYEAQARPQTPKPHQILDAFFGTSLRFARQGSSGAIFMRLLSRSATDPVFFIRNFVAQESEEVIFRFKNALFNSLPEVPQDEIVWRFHFMLGAMSYALAGIDVLKVLAHIDVTPSELEGADEVLQARLMAFLLGGLRAPLPEAELPALAKRTRSVAAVKRKSAPRSSSNKRKADLAAAK